MLIDAYLNEISLTPVKHQTSPKDTLIYLTSVRQNTQLLIIKLVLELVWQSSVIPIFIMPDQPNGFLHVTQSSHSLIFLYSFHHRKCWFAQQNNRNKMASQYSAILLYKGQSCLNILEKCHQFNLPCNVISTFYIYFRAQKVRY